MEKKRPYFTARFNLEIPREFPERLKAQGVTRTASIEEAIAYLETIVLCAVAEKMED